MHTYIQLDLKLLKLWHLMVYKEVGWYTCIYHFRYDGKYKRTKLFVCRCRSSVGICAVLIQEKYNIFNTCCSLYAFSMKHYPQIIFMQEPKYTILAIWVSQERYGLKPLMLVYVLIHHGTRAIHAFISPK